MDEETKNFYVLYENIDSDELKLCKSLEINTMVYYKYIQNHLNKLLEDKIQSPDDITKIKNALSVLHEMIKKEQRKSFAPNIFSQTSIENNIRGSEVEPSSYSSAPPRINK